jgi:magnesium chelatase subunit D
MSARADPWADALTAAALALVDPAGLGGVWLRARHGPVREAFLAAVNGLVPPSAPRRRIGPSTEVDRLIGGLDFAATLASGRSVMETGVLPSVSGGLLTLAMAERTTRITAALVGSALDSGTVRIERDGFSAELAARFALVALDEGIDDEQLPAILAERLAFRVELEGYPRSIVAPCPVGAGAVGLARERLPGTTVPDDLVDALTRSALAAGGRSTRVALFLCRAARAAAALRGAEAAAFEDAVLAARLVLGPALPVTEEADPAAPAEETPAGGETAPGDTDGDGDGDGALSDRIVQAAAATLPDGVLDSAGSAGAVADAATARRCTGEEQDGPRGPVTGIAARPPRPGARLDVLATIRTAAPWQAVRRRQGTARGAATIAVTADDFRWVRRRQPQGTTAILVVDASGSAAAARLAETKGAVELLLSECYVRRDEVALVSFRGARAETLLEPTRSLVRAKRSLAGLPGGGPTPLAHGIVAATELALALSRRGRATIAVFLTDGRGNVALDGRHGRDAARVDATAAARRFRALGLRGVVIDTGMRPQPAVDQLAGELGADYVALPRGGADRISAELVARLGR